MVNYNLGKIYKLTSDITGQVYVGSTTENYLSQRLQGHLRHYRHYNKHGGKFVRSYIILGCEDYKIDLIEEWPCNNKEQLVKKEDEYILKYREEYGDLCVNKVRSHLTEAEKKQWMHEYKDKNRDELNEKRRTTFYTCECGSHITLAEKSRHFRSDKHKIYVANNYTNGADNN